MYHDPTRTGLDMRERRLAATDDDSTAEYRDLHDHVSWAGLGVRERWVAATDDDGWEWRWMQHPEARVQLGVCERRMGAPGLTPCADELFDPPSGNQLGVRERRLAAAGSGAKHRRRRWRMQYRQARLELGLRERRLGAAGLAIGADELHDPASGNELGLCERRLAAARSSAGNQCADRGVELPRVGTSGWLGLRERRVGPAESPPGDWRGGLASRFQFSASPSSNNEKGRESCGLFPRTTRVRKQLAEPAST